MGDPNRITPGTQEWRERTERYGEWHSKSISGAILHIGIKWIAGVIISMVLVAGLNTVFDVRLNYAATGFVAVVAGFAFVFSR